MIEHWMKIARNYSDSNSSVLLIAEDIDRAGADRKDEDLNSLLNTIGGSEMTQTQKLVHIIFTSNNIQNITDAMLRPGRIDFPVNFGYLDVDTIKMLMTSRLSKYKGFDSLDLDAAIRKIDGEVQGSVVNELCKRAAEFFIITDNEENGLEISQDSLLAAVNQTNEHLRLLRGAKTGFEEKETIDGLIQKYLLEIGSKTKEAVMELLNE